MEVFERQDERRDGRTEILRRRRRESTLGVENRSSEKECDLRAIAQVTTMTIALYRCNTEYIVNKVNETQIKMKMKITVFTEFVFKCKITLFLVFIKQLSNIWER